MRDPHLSEVINVPPFVFLSGQLAFYEDTIVAGGVAVQTKQCVQNIVRVLEPLALGLTDVVKTTVWLRNSADFASFDEAYADVFGEHRPARSTVISDLVVADALVEIEVLAYRRANE